jgi:hypothetical protein
MQSGDPRGRLTGDAVYAEWRCEMYWLPAVSPESVLAAACG